jgi:hypothetical protein
LLPLSCAKMSVFLVSMSVVVLFQDGCMWNFCYCESLQINVIVIVSFKLHVFKLNIVVGGGGASYHWILWQKI